MPFLPVLSGPGQRIFGRRVRLYVQPYGPRRRLNFALSRALVEHLSWQGGDRLIVAIGVGADAGQFQISRVKRARAGVSLHAFSNGHGFRCAVTLAPGDHGVDPAELLNAFKEPADLPFSIVNGALVCALPPRTAADAANVTSIGARSA